MLRQITCVSALLFTINVHAGSFAIQLEASHTPMPESYSSLSEYGRVYTLPVSEDGLTRTRLGPYSTEKEARAVLKQVRKNGHIDAFLAQDHIDFTPNNSATDTRSSVPDWSSLTEEQRANVVYLDGVLHIKNGDTFTPISELLNE